MSSFGRRVSRSLSAYDYFAKMLAYLGGALIVVMMVMIAVATTSRYFFGHAMATVTELSAYSLLVVTFLGAPHLARTAGHISVDIIHNAVKGKARTILDVFANFVSVLVCLYVAIVASLTAYDSYAMNERIVNVLGTPKYMLFSVIALGAFFTAIAFVFTTVEVILSRSGGRTEVVSLRDKRER